MRHLLEAPLKSSLIRMLERAGGGLLLLLGLSWLVLGLRSISGENFVFRGAVVVVVISFVLMLAGATLAKPRSSKAGRVFAATVCVLGALRELMLMDHQAEISFASGGWIGVTLLVLYAAILVVVVMNHILERRAAPA